jgi:hypothetical protein
MVDLKRAETQNKIKKKVEEKAKEIIGVLGTPERRKATYEVTVISYQKKNRWLKNDPTIPRQDWGMDLDNLLKPVFDGLGPIIGYRKDWTGKKEHSGVLDSSIIEVHAKKANSGSGNEYLGIEVELIHVSEANDH